jgi:D-3-phosphoglycerate dehydrogenase
MSVKIKRVLISDNVDQKCADLLKLNGIEVISKCGLSASSLVEALDVRTSLCPEVSTAQFIVLLSRENWIPILTLQNCDGLIVRSDTKVTREIIEASKSLKVIGRAGTGVDNIDTDAATRKGIIVLK